MRRIFGVLLGLALAVPATARAQTYAVDRGSWRIGGTAGWGGRTHDGRDGRDVTAFLAPSAQLFVLPGLALGADVELNRTETSGDLRLSGIGAGPTATYYFGRGPRPFYPYVGGSAVFTHLDVSGAGLTPSSSGSMYTAYAGLLTMLARNVGVDTRLYLARQLVGGNLSDNGTAYGLSVGISAFVF